MVDPKEGNETNDETDWREETGKRMAKHPIDLWTLFVVKEPVDKTVEPIVINEEVLDVEKWPPIDHPEKTHTFCHLTVREKSIAAKHM